MRYVVDPAAVDVGPAAWFFLLVTCGILPLAVVRQHRSLMTGVMSPPTRERIYASALATHAFLLLMVWLVARNEGIDLLPPYRPNALHVVIGAVALAIGLIPILERFERVQKGAMAHALTSFRVEDATVRARTRMIAPRNAREQALFYVVSVSAGVAEQLAFRGLLFTLLAVLIGGWWIPAVLAAAVFGIVHVFQGWKGAGVAALIGLRDQVVVGLTGTLFVAMAVHALHDVIAGTVLGLRVRRDERLHAGDATLDV